MGRFQTKRGTPCKSTWIIARSARPFWTPAQRDHPDCRRSPLRTSCWLQRTASRPHRSRVHAYSAVKTAGILRTTRSVINPICGRPRRVRGFRSRPCCEGRVSGIGFGRSIQQEHRSMTDQDRTLVRISFETIQQSLRNLAETMAQKMYREAPGLLAAPPYVGPTMFTMIRHEE
jgi:hypothetical protein